MLHLMKPRECTTVTPNVDHELGVMMTCQGRFIICNKCPTHTMLTVGKAVHGEGGNGNSLLSLSYAVNLKLL